MANANVMIAFFIHLHIVISDVKNVRNITNSRKTSFLLNRLRNIQIVMKLSYLRRLSRIVERDIYILQRLSQKLKKDCKILSKVRTAFL